MKTAKWNKKGVCKMKIKILFIKGILKFEIWQ